VLLTGADSPACSLTIALQAGIMDDAPETRERSSGVPTSVEVRPAVLAWARTRASLSTDALADIMEVPQAEIVAWEATGSLSLARLRSLAKRTRTPIGFFFLQNPPASALSVADFRTVTGTLSRPPSPELLDTLHICQRRQSWYRESLVAEQPEPVSIVGSASSHQAVAAVAESVRSAIGWDVDTRRSLPTWEDALTVLAERMEDIGILVMRSGVVGNNTHRALDVDEFRGFALSDEYAPLVFVNSSDARAAQMFTLAHEVTHIWLGETGVSDAQPRSSNASERFCNSVAAEILVPLDEFSQTWTQSRAPDVEAQRLARMFKVSVLVILRRALEARAVSASEFEGLYEDALAASASRVTGGGDFYNTQGARLGKRFSRAVIISALEGRTPFAEAFGLLGVRSSKTFDAMAKRFGVLP